MLSGETYEIHIDANGIKIDTKIVDLFIICSFYSTWVQSIGSFGLCTLFCEIYSSFALFIASGCNLLTHFGLCTLFIIFFRKLQSWNCFI